VNEDKATLSPSRANDYLKCPLFYRFRTIDKLPEPPSVEAIRGTLVHSVLEKLFSYPRIERTYEIASVDIHPIWQEMKSTKEDIAQILPELHEDEFLLSSLKLLQRYFELENPQNFEPTELETYVEYDLNENLSIHGYIDRLDIAPTGEIRIVDYKTGKSPGLGFEEKSFFQMKFYALILWKSLGRMPKRLQIIFLGDGKILTQDPTEEDIVKTQKKIEKISSDIEQSKVSGVWPTRKSKLCNWCAHQKICPEFGGTPPLTPINIAQVAERPEGI
jgi:putative RecB family exonuclease